jgi:hypothetical protein
MGVESAKKKTEKIPPAPSSGKNSDINDIGAATTHAPKKPGLALIRRTLLASENIRRQAVHPIIRNDPKRGKARPAKLG